MSLLAFPLDDVLSPTGTVTAKCTPSKPISSIAADSFPAHSLAFKDADNAMGKVPLVTMRTISETESRKNRKKAKDKKLSRYLANSAGGDATDSTLHPIDSFHDQPNHLSNLSDNGSSHKKKSSPKKKAGSGFENTGRWTSDEHQLFLNGLDSYGKEWKKIAELIKTRTVVQIRTHAQKYFQKVAKAREQANEAIPATFRSTAMFGPKPRAAASIKMSGTKKRKSMNRKGTSQNGGTPKRCRGRVKSVSSKGPKKKQSNNVSSYMTSSMSLDDNMVSFKVDLGNNDHHHQMKQFNLAETLADPLSIRLDLFRNTQPLPFQFEAGSGTMKFGGNSPTTAVVDLFSPDNFGSDSASSGLCGLDFLDADIDGYDFEESNEGTSDVGTGTCNSGETTPSGSPLPIASRGRTDTNNAYPKKHAHSNHGIKSALHSAIAAGDKVCVSSDSLPISVQASVCEQSPPSPSNNTSIKPIKLHDGSPSLAAISGMDLPMALRSTLLDQSASSHCLNSLPTPAGAGILRRAGGTRHSQFRASGEDEDEEDDESFMSGLLGELTS